MNLAELFIGDETYLRPLRRFDQNLMQSFAPAKYYASIRVLELTK